MNLLNLLMNSMTSQSSVDTLSQNTGVSGKKTSLLIKLVLPLLLKYMTQNASSQSGALSLANALTQHTDTSSMTQQFSNADVNDGNAIIQHILGSDSNQVVNSLASQTDISNDQVMSLLGNMAPGLLSGLSAATSSAQTNTTQADAGAFDFSSLMNSFSTGTDSLQELPQEDGSGSSGAFGSFTEDDSNNGNALISSLLSVFK